MAWFKGMTNTKEGILNRDVSVLVAGAGGFIGGHLVRHLKRMNVQNIRAVDIKPLEQWHQLFDGVENLQLDLSKLEACYTACKDIDWVYNLAADMGGMGFIESHKADCMLSVLINTHLLMSARDQAVKRYFFASSACVYAADKQQTPDNPGLQESDAYPAQPEDGYGWEKLFSERMCRHFSEDYGLVTRVGRYHNVYGPSGTFDGGREKAPAAICRKVYQAKSSGSQQIEIWGDGLQTRSFMYIDDCLAGTTALMESDYSHPLNIGSSEIVTINQLVEKVERIAGLHLTKVYDVAAPKGVRGRSSDNSLVRKVLGWEPTICLDEGLRLTYEWISEQLRTSQSSKQ